MWLSTTQIKITFVESSFMSLLFYYSFIVLNYKAVIQYGKRLIGIDPLQEAYR